jgi:hypothetical protein
MYTAEPVNKDSESGESDQESDQPEPADAETEQGDPDQNGNGREPILSFVFGSGPDAAPATPATPAPPAPEPPQDEAEPTA